VLLGFLTFYMAGAMVFSIAAGAVAQTVLDGSLTMGAVAAVRETLRQLIAVVAMCVVATWLYFSMARRLRERAPAQPISQ
jgi:uncharacterized BrkB/YihY/UPF0761 family membrane protein